tara:strand:+ start:76 stop:786 length:711 start_codon:yes stop_codon:yes gene_type:complete
MTEWWNTIPTELQIILIMLTLVCVTAVSLWGRIRITWGRRKIGIGKENNNRGDKQCMECTKYHRAEAAKFNFKISRVESETIQAKMNYVEQQLLDLKSSMYSAYSDMINEEPDMETKLDNFNIRIKLSLYDVIQDEIRRSIKENGFHTKKGEKFETYVNTQITVIHHRLEEVLLTFYKSTIIQTLLKRIQGKFENSIRKIYQKCKELELDSKKKISEYESAYDNELDILSGLKERT